MFKKTASILIVTLLLLSLVPSKVFAAPAVAKVRINRTSAVIAVGSRLALRTTVAPKGADRKVVWSSSNKRIATVNSGGRVTAKKAGKVRITATSRSGQQKAVCTITIKNPKISLSRNHVTTNEGSQFSLTAKISPSLGVFKNVTWSSSNTEIATVNSSGVVQTNEPGTVEITAWYMNQRKTCTVTVNAMPKYLYDLETFYEEQNMSRKDWDWNNFRDNTGQRYNRGWYYLGRPTPGMYYSPGIEKYVYLINGKYGRMDGVFALNIGSKDLTNPRYSCVLEIYGDKKKLYESPAIRGGVLPASFNVSLLGVNELEVRITVNSPGSLSPISFGLLETKLYRPGY